MIPKIREFYDKTIIAAGAISNGQAIRASQVLGADYAYMGTRFIATKECGASVEYKQMIVNEKDGPAPFRLPVLLTNKLSGIHANFLRKSIESNNIDLDKLENPNLDFSKLDLKNSKAWKDIWSAGHGVLTIHDIPSVKDLVDKLVAEYEQCKQ